MTKVEQTAKLNDLQTEAKDYQARYGYLEVQVLNIQEELKALRVLLSAGEAKFKQVQQAPVDPEPSNA